VAIQSEIPVSSAVTEEPGPVATGPYVVGGFDDTGQTGGTGIVGPGSTDVQVPTIIEEPVPISGEIVEPFEVFRLNPVYPEAARRARIQGTVILEAVITKMGEVQSVRILRSAHPLLDRAALDAVPQWRYKPAKLNGRPLAVYLTVTVHFQLR
jgi:protein TonB